MGVMHHRFFMLCCLTGVFAVACGDDASMASDAGRRDASMVNGVDAMGGGEGGGGGDVLNRHTCKPSNACAECVAATCCSDQEACGGFVDVDWGKRGVIPTPRHVCFLDCLEQCVAREGSLDALAREDGCKLECFSDGPGAFNYYDFQDAFVSCVAPSVSAGADDDAGSEAGAGHSPGCVAECFPSVLGDLDAGGT